MNNALGKKLRELRKERKWTLEEVAEKLGLKSYSTYSNWEYGRSVPSEESLYSLAELYDVPLETLFELAFTQRNGIVSGVGTGKTSVMFKVAEEFFKQKNSRVHRMASEVEDPYISVIYPNPPYSGTSNDPPLYASSILNVPILGCIRAGLPLLAQEHIKDWMRIPNMWNLKEGEVFVLEVVGDSMIGSRIYEGDKVIVKVQPDVESGEIAVVNVNGSDATLKRVKKIDGQVILYPDNPRYEPMVVQHEDARIIGKVIQVMFEPGK